jgi:hypothetical protein
MSQNLIDAIHIISASSADALEVNSESPADDMFVHTLTSYARAKRESLNALRVVASMGNATTEEEVRRDFETTATRCFRRITPEQITAIFEALLADQKALSGTGDISTPCALLFSANP